ncbi:MAG: YdcF family protein [Cytophagales bacterium]|nr:YdcF family protein [Cytophagales bacterium]
MITKNPRRKSRLRIVAVIFILLFSNPWLSHVVIRSMEEEPVQLQKNYRIGIVLSGMLESGITITDQIHLAQGADRIIEAVRLYNRGAIQNILISGGKADINFPEENEGEKLVELVRSMGVPDSAIMLENQSHNTFENAKFTGRLLANDTSDLLLITSAFHMKRALACFTKQNIKVDTYPVDYRAPSDFRWAHMVPKSSALENWNMVIKEIVGLIAYKVAGYI